MSVHLYHEIEKLKKEILSMSALVADSLHQAVTAVTGHQPELASEVAKRDLAIDAKEVEIEEECLKILALYQPVASDLRFIVAVLKINNTLERVGDHAVNIAGKAGKSSIPAVQPMTEQLRPIFDEALKMLQKALDSLVNQDVPSARQVCADDDILDNLKKQLRDRVLAELTVNPANAKPLLAVMGIARNLERVGDLATNIAEDVIYMVDGAIIRHQGPNKDA